MKGLLKEAIEYKRLGFSVIVVSKSKRAIHKWKNYQKRHIHEGRLRRLLNTPEAFGIGVICGDVSNNLEVIDIDEKYVKGRSLFEEYLIKLDYKDAKLITQLAVACTKNKGFHFLYTCNKVERSRVLARRPCTKEELLIEPYQKVKVLIETRGIGGYIIVFPTPNYQFIQKDLYHLPHISEKQRELLLDIARSFNSYKEPKSIQLTNSLTIIRTESPFEDFNKRGDIIGLLRKHGWIVVKQDKQKTYFRRPGETEHNTSGDYHHEMGLFTLFSSSTEFAPNKGYKPYAVYAILECNGDFKLAAKKLLAEGYGVPYNQQ